MNTLTNEELIKRLQQLPLDATITIAPSYGRTAECTTVQYHDLGNEIILGDAGGFDEFGVLDFMSSLIGRCECPYPGDEDDYDDDVFNACGIW